MRHGGFRCDRRGEVIGVQGGQWPVRGCNFHGQGSGLHRAPWCVGGSESTRNLSSFAA